MGPDVARWLAAIAPSCAEVNRRQSSLIQGWVTARVFGDESSPHILVFRTNPLSPHSKKQANNHHQNMVYVVAEKKKWNYIGTYHG